MADKKAKKASAKPTSANRTIDERQRIDAWLAESEKDFKEGHTYGPFNTAAEMIAHMKAALKMQSPPKTKRKQMKINH